MPTCKFCHQHFPNIVLIDNKPRNLHGRKYCLYCSPFGQHNTRPISSIGEKPQIGCCIICQQPLKNRRRKVCPSCNTNRRRFVIKEKMILYKGGKCSRCGYNRCNAALEFHHLDPQQKSFSLASNHSRSWKTIQKELDKCILVCSNCHREINDEQFQLTSIRYQHYLQNKKN